MTPVPLLVTLTINEIEHDLAPEPRRTLLDALRYDLQLTGTKKVCDMGDCGAYRNILRAGRLAAEQQYAETVNHAPPTHRGAAQRCPG